MNTDTAQLIGLAVLILAEQYMIAPWQFNVFARVWDAVAKICAFMADILGWVSMQARLNYYQVVSYGG